MDKYRLRKEYLERRIALTDAERSKLDDLLLIQLQRTALPFVRTLLNYVPMEHKAEPDTHLFVRYLGFLYPGLRTAYPVTDLDKASMEAYLVDDDTEFEERRFGLVEPLSELSVAPEDIDLVIVPLLISDKNGHRVGYGKGIYDRYLARCRKDTLKLGFSFFAPVDEISDIHENDITLDVLVHPEGVIYF